MAYVSYSIGEIGSLCLRAVRGAGHPWGVAEEASWAVRWLIRAGLPGGDALADALEASDLSALSNGISAADMAEAPTRLCPSDAMLTLPFLARLAQPGHALCYGSPAFRIARTACDLDLSDAELDLVNPVADWPVTLKTRADVSKDVYARLQVFAARTYAPETEESRARGAGAGLTDND